MRRPGLLLVTFLGAAAAVRGQSDTPLHRPEVGLGPDRALWHLQKGHTRRELARTDEERAALEPVPRPFGAGRHLAVVLASDGLPLEPHRLLVQRPRDLLTLASPGPTVAPATAARIGGLVADQGVTLVVVMVRRDVEARMTTLAAGDSPAAEGVRRELARTRALARRHELPFPVAWGLRQQHALLDLLPGLKQRRTRFEFNVAIAIVDPHHATLRWHAPWADGWPIAVDAPAPGSGR